ncbi:MAG: methyltransferase domain-containing protein [candidate division WOR-3 bacterium]
MSQQQVYDHFAKNTDIETQDRLSGSVPLRVEKEIINKYKPKTLLDIGCGSGNRMFPFYREQKIKYKGIEKFSEVIEQSKYQNDIFCLDIGSENFIKDFRQLDKGNYEMVVLFGVINAFIDENLRRNAWKNLNNLINKDNILVVNTLSHFDWFNRNDIGQIITLPQIPPQYFYSEKELKKIFQNNGFKIKEEYEDDYGFIKVRYYVLIK